MPDSVIYPIILKECHAAADNRQQNCAAPSKQIMHQSKRPHQKTQPAFHCAVSTAYAFNGLGICQGLSKMKNLRS